MSINTCPAIQRSRIRSYLGISGILTNLERAKAEKMITGNIQESACK